MKEAKKTVGVRLEVRHYALLKDKAKQLKLQPTTYATQILIASLDAHEQHKVLIEVRELSEQLRELSDQVERLQANLRNGILGILHHAGEMNPREINKWAEVHLKR